MFIEIINNITNKCLKNDFFKLTENLNAWEMKQLQLINKTSGLKLFKLLKVFANVIKARGLM